ncbi:MAG: hypothetical protein H7321_04820 [Bacteroidia bacterium]|nr:hypothetical protein [Bacteroidia bacterium]
MNNTLCQDDHRYLGVLTNLVESQKPEEGRHRCAGCAYTKGVDDGINGNVRNINVDDLPLSQAGTGRHKSCTDAYDLGYNHGVAQRP